MNMPSSVWLALAGLPLLALPTVQQCGGDDDDYTPGPAQYDLAQPVDVQYDGVGVPHIEGDSLPDVAFTQGYVTARDRLWQMDFLRRQAKGELAELFGQGSYDDDLYVKVFGIEYWATEAARDMQKNDPEMYEMLEAYAAGVNAYLNAAIEGRDGASLPPQILAVGYVPDQWTVVDSLSIDKALAFGSSQRITEELTIWLVSKLIGEDLTADLLRPKPNEAASIVDGFYDGLGTPMEQPVRKPSASRTGNGLSPEQLKTLLEKVKSHKYLEGFGGSNSWVISGEHTASGAPILANDTHEGVGAPPTYYQVHLKSNDPTAPVDAVGYGFAGMPMFLLGHNDIASWGFTLNMMDASDIYQETLVGNAVMHNGQLVPLDTREETIYVRPDGGAVTDAVPQQVTVQIVPHHGPLLPPEMLGDIPLNLSVAWTGANIGTITSAAMKLKDIQSFEDLREGMSVVTAGGVNVVYADVFGNIGYTTRVDVPIREQLDPANPPYMVLPGDGGYEWNGIYSDDFVPWTYNPALGYVVTANNEVAGLLHDNDPFNGPYIQEINGSPYLSIIYDVGHRAQRITDLIQAAAGTGGITEQDVMAWQADNVSLLADKTLPYLLEAAANREDLVTGDLVWAVDALKSFANSGYHCTTDSAGALVFHAWLAYALADMYGDETDPALFTDLDGTYLNMFSRPFIHFLQATDGDIVAALDYQATGACKFTNTDPRCDVKFPSQSGLNFFDNQDTTDVVETRDATLLGSLSKAVAELATRGALAGQTWGDIHKIKFNDQAERVGYYDNTLGPYTIDGGMFTVDVADARVASGGKFVTSMDVGTAPSQRTIFTMKEGQVHVFDVLPGGQSERAGTTFHADQLDMYLNNQYRVLPFYEAEVTADLSQTLDLPVGFPASGTPVWE